MPYSKSGGKQCVAYGCKNNQKKLYLWENADCEQHKGQIHKDCPCIKPFKLHCIPKNEDIRRCWLKFINRRDFNPSTVSLVCSVHFIDGKPTKENPVPSLNMGYTTKEPTPTRRPLVRRSLNLNTPNERFDEDHAPMEVDDSHIYVPTTPSEEDMFIATPLQSCATFKNSIDVVQCDSVCCTKHPDLCDNRPILVDSSTQTIDIIALDHCYFYSRQTKDVATQHSSPEFSAENVTTDLDARFYTGLSLTLFLTLISTLAKFGEHLKYKLDVKNQILLVFVRLRLGLTFMDIGRRFGISSQLTSDIFYSWIHIMSEQLSTCISWLPRDSIKRTMPRSFKQSYPNTTCIIDCSELFIQRPFSLKARAQTWSTYKSHNTAKFLIAIAPNGYIMFISPLYGGRASDNYITKNCGFLNYLLPGDEVMADRGFTISEELCARRVKLNIPAFLKGRSQLSEKETIESRRIAAERIHVERAIMRLKSYRLLNTRLTNKSLKFVNKTLHVIGALCNLRDPLIKDYDID